MMVPRSAASVLHDLLRSGLVTLGLRLQKQMVTVELLTIDELGFVLLPKTGIELLFELIMPTLALTDSF